MQPAPSDPFPDAARLAVVAVIAVAVHLLSSLVAFGGLLSSSHAGDTVHRNDDDPDRRHRRWTGSRAEDRKPPAQSSRRSSRFAAGDPCLDTDAVFGVKRPLIAPFVAIDGNGKTVAELDFDFVLVLAEKRLRTDSATSLGCEAFKGSVLMPMHDVSTVGECGQRLLGG